MPMRAETNGGTLASGATRQYCAPWAYDPIEFRTVGDGGGTTLHFAVYETLPLDASTRKLLSVAAQHPDAPVSTSPAEFAAAQARLFPHGYRTPAGRVACFRSAFRA
jgi:hypothetical protein